MKRLFFLIISTICIAKGFSQKSDVHIKNGDIIYTCPPCGCPVDDQKFDKMGTCEHCNMRLTPELYGIELKRHSTKRPSVGIFLFDMADIMDVTGPMSVFEHAGFRIMTFGLDSEAKMIGMNLEMKPDYSINNLPNTDVLLFPGGGMSERDPGNEKIQSFIKSRIDSTDLFFSVCSGAFFLAEAGLLNNKKATTFASLIPQLEKNYPEVHVLNDVKYTVNDKVITSAGLSSGIDASFQVVSKYYGNGRAMEIANHMEYPWQDADEYARSQLADNFIMNLNQLMRLFAISFEHSDGDYNQWRYEYVLTSQLRPEDIFNSLKKELEKNESWSTQSTSKLKLTGLYKHESLGDGNIILEIIPSEGKTKAIISTERVIRYSRK